MSPRPCAAVAMAFVVAACSTALPPANAPPPPAAPVPSKAEPAPPKAQAAKAPEAKPTEVKAPEAKAPAHAQPPAAAPKAASPPPARVAAAPAAAPRAAAPPPLDLKSLEERLKETNAVGVLTKLSLKNQVDDLIARFRAYHAGQRPPTLSELRPTFELLLMKVLSLLQDKDAALAHDINASREAIWAVLTDRDKLTQFN